MIFILVEGICNMLPGWGWMIVEVPPAEGLLALSFIRIFRLDLFNLEVGDLKINCEIDSRPQIPIHTVQQLSEVGMG